MSVFGPKRSFVMLLQGRSYEPAAAMTICTKIINRLAIPVTPASVGERKRRMISGQRGSGVSTSFSADSIRAMAFAVRAFDSLAVSMSARISLRIRQKLRLLVLRQVKAACPGCTVHPDRDISLFHGIETCGGNLE